MRRLLAADLLPERAGQPVKAWVHISLADLRALDRDSALEKEWIAGVRGRWAAARAGRVGDGAAWLDGDAAGAMTCDASIAPVVTGEVNPGVLEDLAGLCLQLAGHGPHWGRAGRRAGDRAAAAGKDRARRRDGAAGKPGARS